MLGRGYIAIVRGVPDIAYFLFFVIALDQILEWMRHKALCRDWSEPIRQGNDFVVCDAAKLPLSSAAPWVHDLYGFALAVFTFGMLIAGSILLGVVSWQKIIATDWSALAPVIWITIGYLTLFSTAASFFMLQK